MKLTSYNGYLLQGLGVPEAMLYSRVAHHNETGQRVSIADIAKSWNRHHSQISRTVNKLVSAGYMAKTDNGLQVCRLEEVKKYTLGNTGE